MRTNVEIDDRLMAAAMEAGSFKTKREAVEEGLRLIARRKSYQDIRALRGKIRWDDSQAAEPAWEPERAVGTVGVRLASEPARAYRAGPRPRKR